MPLMFMPIVRPSYLRNEQLFGNIQRRKVLFRKVFDDLKSVPCADGGVMYSPWVLEFDHVIGERLFNVSQGHARCVRMVLAEAAKCEIVNSNRHADRTWRRRGLAPSAGGLAVLRTINQGAEARHHQCGHRKCTSKKGGLKTTRP